MENLPIRFLKYFGIVFILLSSLPGWSQSPFFSKAGFALPIEEPVFQVAAQDRTGYLWLGSDQGLFRFDGKEFIKYAPPADSGDFHVTSLHVEPGNTLWIGCKDGSIFYFKNEEMTSFSPEEGTAGKGISDILVDTNGMLWWSTYGEGIYLYTGSRVFNINHEDGLSDDYVYDLETGKSGQLIAATDNGISIVGWKENEKYAEACKVNSTLPDIIVRSLDKDEKNTLWLSFHDAGLGYLEDDLSKFTSHGEFKEWDWGPVNNMVFSGGQIWFGTFSRGIVQIDPGDPDKVKRWESDDRGNSFGRIHDLLKDREGNIWVLASTGLYRSTGTRLQYLRDAAEWPMENIHALLKDSAGYLWFSDDQGLCRVDLTDGTVRRYLDERPYRNIKIMSLLEDRHGFIWAGTFDYGLFRLDPRNGKYRQITEKEGLVNNNVLSISSHLDTLWTATLGGASNIILQGNSLDSPLELFSFNQENGLVNTFIYDIYEDRQNRIWFATDGDGICVFSGGTFHCFNESDGIGDDVIYSITGDPEGNIWFSTASDGIYRFDGAVFRHFGTEAGLRSMEISSLEISGNEVVVVHGMGIDVLHMPSMHFSHYADESGLAETAPELNAIFVDRDGVLWIGTQHGIIRYQSGNSQEIFSPHTVLERMSVLFQPIRMEDRMSLNSNQNHVSFKYAGLWLSSPEKVIYRVQLEGYDLDWKETYDMTATYSSLPPGEYTFRVLSSLDQSFSNSEEASFKFRIKSPFYVSFWFIGLLIFLIGSSVYAYIRYRENRLRIIEQQKKEKVEFEFQLLKNQVNPHFLFNSFSTLISLIEDDRDQAMQYTEKLSDFFRKVLQLKETEIIPLKEELDLIDDYLFILRKRYGDLIILEKDLDENIQDSSIPPMTLQMLIENAVKHNIISKDKPLKIKIYVSGDALIVENNNQPKRHKEVSTGIGLENISRRYLLLSDRDIRIEGQDDVFRVLLPLL